MVNNIDTNILIYATDDQSPFHEKALKMFNRFMADGAECVISPQIIREYLVVLTRGMAPEDPARTAIFNNGIHRISKSTRPLMPVVTLP
ncbi:MAG: hypothetical protein WA081_22760 [Desulfosalsimonadaceae bacterium]